MKTTEKVAKENVNLKKRPFFFQPKLTVNQPGDKYEQEADVTADKVMGMQIPPSQNFFKPASAPIQRKCKNCEEEDKKLHRKEGTGPQVNNGLHSSVNNAVFFNLPITPEQRKCSKCGAEHELLHRKEGTGTETKSNSSLDNYVNSLSSSGQPLPVASRQFFEPRFGHDFSNVRIHTDSVAAKSAQSINALAYTTGNNIVFNRGQFSPGSSSGDRLLAHELTHVVQQNGLQKMEIQRIAPVVVVSAIVLAVVGCSYVFYKYALDNYSSKGDKWMHCWCSCKIASYCGGNAVAVLVGAGKEVVDAALDQLGYAANAEWADFVADLKGVVCSDSGGCVECCDQHSPAPSY
jgi:hypothetical protein